ncbi:MAG: FkbM family methyltransferase [Cyanosarcina radialis HA8281-LM2]|jgi:FkbM family methyltransferase|nr:FkbM family methyltransferase [Cyanosarcina radialis HA8281-LM2]
MEIASVVYERYLASKGISKKAWNFVRRATIELFRDPTCSLPIHGRNLKLPLSHLLPEYLRQFPHYDRLPQRISEYIHQQQGYLNCIDVGANIGDTIAAFYKEDADIFLAIEPNEKFRNFLVENCGWNKNVTAIADLCSSESSASEFVIQEKNGTAIILQAENGVSIRRRTLDEIVRDNSIALNANVLKIDTDGHDFKVISGAKELIKQNMPVILFECDNFENSNYIEDCLNTLTVLKQIGYNYFLLYDNVGHLMGRYSLSELSPFRHLLFYQLTKKLYYYDILLMNDRDISQFYSAEIDYFVRQMPNKSLPQTAIAAAKLDE